MQYFQQAESQELAILRFCLLFRLYCNSKVNSLFAPQLAEMPGRSTDVPFPDWTVEGVRLCFDRSAAACKSALPDGRSARLSVLLESGNSERPR